MNFAAMIEKFRDTALNEGLDVLLDQIMEDTGYTAMLKAQGDEGQTRMENIG